MSRDGQNGSERVAAEFGRNLRTLRRKAGLSQRELGARASVHRTEIGRLEKGERLARVDTTIRLCGALEVTPTELFRGIRWTLGAGHLEGDSVIDGRNSFARRHSARGSAGESQTGLSKAITTLRAAAGLSLAGLSGRSEMERSQLEAIERAEVDPTVDEMRRIAEGLGTHWSVVLREVERFESELGN